MTKQLMRNMTNEDLLGKIESEGPEYFFLEYVDPDFIQDEYLQSNVRTLRLAWEEIMSDIAQLEDEIDD